MSIWWATEKMDRILRSCEVGKRKWGEEMVEEMSEGWLVRGKVSGSLASYGTVYCALIKEL